MQHVENSEENLEMKKRHCRSWSLSMAIQLADIGADTNVVKAFESALALLNNRVNH